MVRHGKTFFNTTGQVQGFCDSPLTGVGIEQAQLVGAGLKDVKFVAAYSGELGRQIKTAKLILEQNDNEIPMLVENVGFNEWNYGGYEGGTNAAMWNPIFEEYGYTFDEEWTHYGEVYEILGDRGIADAIAANDALQAAESYDEILARAGAAMNQLVEESLAAGGGNVLVVSSGSQIPTILEMYVPDDYNGEDIGNCSVTILKYKDGNYTMEVVGDTSYREG
ncbi:histidine phosphatase family protein [Kineothrix sp. MB12-C1]|uniref:histidine phosphatase family protein n=1 Tax=Kineothrix sp. MB12-C1 TaxID=3070215 RepID=UPI0027D28725|nr:histidine phosphatase family protein [Kineothrix sp. MB12-C1]WMC94298.1 histidine phosphatase family protein [Kineothrix sp. MB12-C1]